MKPELIGKRKLSKTSYATYMWVNQNVNARSKRVKDRNDYKEYTKKEKYHSFFI